MPIHHVRSTSILKGGQVPRSGGSGVKLPSDTEVESFLRKAPATSELNVVELKSIRRIATVKSFRSGQYVFQESERGDGLYLLYSGRVQVVRRVGSEQRVVDTLSSPTCLGVTGMLTGSSHSAGVRAESVVVVIQIPKGQFDSLLRADNIGAYKLVHQLALLQARRHKRILGRAAKVIGRLSSVLETLPILQDEIPNTAGCLSMVD